MKSRHVLIFSTMLVGKMASHEASVFQTALHTEHVCMGVWPQDVRLTVVALIVRAEK